MARELAASLAAAQDGGREPRSLASRFRWSAPRIVLGGLSLLSGAIGLLLMLRFMDPDAPALRFWPLALVALGSSKILQTWGTAESGSGAWLLATGLWLLLTNFRILGLALVSYWPLLLFALGTTMMMRSSLGVRQRALAASGIRTVSSPRPARSVLGGPSREEPGP